MAYFNAPGGTVKNHELSVCLGVPTEICTHAFLFFIRFRVVFSDSLNVNLLFFSGKNLHYNDNIKIKETN
jgi:hypothetical protein